jgi:predicted P-loop ATPase
LRAGWSPKKYRDCRLDDKKPAKKPEITDLPAETAGQKGAAVIARPELPLVVGANANNSVVINGFKYTGVERKPMQNVMVLTETDDEIKSCFIYNIFADDVFVIKSPPWENPATFVAHPLREDEILNYRCWVDTRGLVVGKNDASDILLALARRNTVNPPKDYFDSLKWDGKPRLDTWLTYYLGASEQNEQYLQLVGSKWMIAAVKRVYEPGCKFDNVLILEGEQYIGKSRALERLATINGSRYFTDEGVDFRGNNKDSLLKLQGKLIFEMPELASFRKAETDEIKAFITRSVDEYRPPYGRKSAPRPRMFVMAGSVNPIAGYLTDPTGNRRYWPVKCGRKIDLDALEADKEQLWAEAVYRYKAKEQIWLEPKEHDLAKVEQQERMIDDIMAEAINDIANELIAQNWVSEDFYLKDLVKRLEIPIYQQDGKLRLRITDCLVGHGYELYKPREKGNQVRKWRRKEVAPPED